MPRTTITNTYDAVSDNWLAAKPQWFTRQTSDEVMQYINAGAAWLDTYCPGWPLEIDLATLDLSSSSSCILGQSAHCVTNGSVESNHAFSYEHTLNWIHDRLLPYTEQRPTQMEWARQHGFLPRTVDIVPDAENDLAYQEDAERWTMLTLGWYALLVERAVGVE